MAPARPLVAAAAFGAALAVLAVWPLADGVAPLSWATARAAAAGLAALGTPVVLQGDLLRHGGGFVAQIHRDCTVLWPAWLLLTGLALSLPRRTATTPLLIAMIIGVLFMAAVNQVRLVAVIWAGVHAPDAFGWLHEGLAPVVQVAAMLAFVGAARIAVAAEDRHHGCSRTARTLCHPAPHAGRHAGADAGCVAGRDAGGAGGRAGSFAGASVGLGAGGSALRER
jgi:exosortase/archaeosortase family protein